MEKGIIDIIPKKLPKSLFKKYFIMTVIGMNQTGKSQFVIKLYKKYLKFFFDRVLIFCNADDMKKKYADMDTAAEIYDTSQIENITGSDIKNEKIGIYDVLKEENKEMKDRILIIIDDYYSKDINKDMNINKLYISGKHVNASVIFICQYMWKMLSELMKNNTHIYVFFKNDIRSWIAIENRIANTISVMYPFLDKKYADKLAKEMYKNVYLGDHKKIIITIDSFYDF